MPFDFLLQLTAKYYMRFTGMSQDRVELNTCRDFFMTPEQALQEGLIDSIIRGKDDYLTPPALVKQFSELGLVDELSRGKLVKTDCA